MDYCTLNCPRWNAGQVEREEQAALQWDAGASCPAMGCRSKAAGARAGEEQICLGIQALAITIPYLSFPAQVYDTFGIYVRLECKPPPPLPPLTLRFWRASVKILPSCHFSQNQQLLLAIL